MPKWVETKTSNERIVVNKQQLPQKKFLTPTTKDAIDLIIKTVGAISIFIPLLLFYKQYDFENQKRRNEKLSELFIDITYDIEVFKNYPDTSKEYKTATDKLLYKYPSQLAIYKNDSLNYYYNSRILEIHKNIVSFKKSKYEIEGYIAEYDSISDLFPGDTIQPKTADVLLARATGDLIFMNGTMIDVRRIFKNDTANNKVDSSMKIIKSLHKVIGDSTSRITSIWDYVTYANHNKDKRLKKIFKLPYCYLIFHEYENILDGLESVLFINLQISEENLQRIVLKTISN